MDLKSLSLFMHTSMAYECTVCKLYFGTEDQLLGHHKKSHSKRLKVSLGPELVLTEDENYTVEASSHSPTDNAGDNNHGMEDHGLVKLEFDEANITNCAENCSAASSNECNDMPSSEDVKPFKRSLDANEVSWLPMVNEDEASPPKRIRVDTAKNTPDQNHSNYSLPCTGAGISVDKDSKAAINRHHPYSNSTKEAIEQGQYGYLTESGFNRFNLEELKKFAVQVVAVFKLDESQHAGRTEHGAFNEITPPSLTISATRKVGAASFIPLPIQIQHEHSSNKGSNSTSSMIRSPNIPSGHDATSGESSTSGNALDVGNKFCFRCGESGHFAKGCTNPRNREIQPKRKTRRGSRRKKNGQQAERAASNNYFNPQPYL